MMCNPFSAIILAAGLSSRMGECKALLTLGKRFILEQVITLFQETGIKDIVVVTGHMHSRIHPVAQRLKTRVVFNPNYRKDMFSSVVSGIAALATGTEAFFIMPVDIPMVRRTTIEHLSNVYQKNKKHLLYPVYKGSRGHPPLIPFSYGKEILKWKNKGGLNEALKRIADQVLEVAVSDPYILLDMDTPTDYEQLQKIWCAENADPEPTGVLSL
jgi:molybdenum cofactor cytidylyltransferase